MKRGFTLVELLVVLGMIAVLVGALGSGVNQARKRAMIAKATQDVKEMTNAILAFENYAPGRSLAGYAKDSWTDTTEGAMAMILGGGVAAEGGGTVPVLYNAQISRGAIRDPWGNPYQFVIKPAGSISSKNSGQIYFKANLPNFYRLSDEERQ